MQTHSSTNPPTPNQGAQGNSDKAYIAYVLLAALLVVAAAAATGYSAMIY